MTELSEEDERILSYLRDRAAGGKRYFRSKGIAEAIGLTAKQVGSRLPRLDEQSEEVDIEKWSRARSTAATARSTLVSTVMVRSSRGTGSSTCQVAVRSPVVS